MTSPRTAPAGMRTLVLLGLVAVYALCYTTIKAGLPFTPPLFFGGLRALIAGAVLLTFAAATRRPLLPDRRGLLWLLPLSFAAITVTYGAMFLSPGRTGAGIAAVLGNTQPLFAMLLAALFLSERLTTRRLTALALGLGGVALISSGALAGAGAYGIAGPLLALGASAGAATGSVMFKRLGPGSDLVTLSAWQLVIGAIPLLTASAIVERDRVVVWNASFIGLLLFLALAGTALAVPAWYWLVRQEEIGRLALSLLLAPVTGLGIAAVAFGEGVGLFEGAGVVLLLIGLGVVAREKPREAPPAATVAPARVGLRRDSPIVAPRSASGSARNVAGDRR